MTNKFFSLDENFNEIIKNTFYDKEIHNVKLIPTGWTNIVFEVTTNCREFFL